MTSSKTSEKRSRGKKQPWRNPTSMVNVSDVWPLYNTLFSAMVKRCSIMSIMVCGTSLWCKILQILLSKSTKSRYVGEFCSFDYSIIIRSVGIRSTHDLPSRNPACSCLVVSYSGESLCSTMINIIFLLVFNRAIHASFCTHAGRLYLV